MELAAAINDRIPENFHNINVVLVFGAASMAAAAILPLVERNKPYDFKWRKFLLPAIGIMGCINLFGLGMYFYGRGNVSDLCESFTPKAITPVGILMFEYLPSGKVVKKSFSLNLEEYTPYCQVACTVMPYKDDSRISYHVN